MKLQKTRLIKYLELSAKYYTLDTFKFEVLARSLDNEFRRHGDIKMALSDRDTSVTPTEIAPYRVQKPINPMKPSSLHNPRHKLTLVLISFAFPGATKMSEMPNE
ncbi:hypothetical protein ACTXT7_009636 [Hymenolepis weldensis]